ncbi:MAG: hypothetical protein FWB78_06015 [Treponema sp.]|nr:hypothetical protein [Treponema sp.]
MLEDEFYKIERNINRFLALFLSGIGINEPRIMEMDTQKLIDTFTMPGNFEVIQKRMEWGTKEQRNRANLFRIARNKYYHTNPNFQVEIIDEISDVTNTIKFITPLKPVFEENIDFIEFEKYLEDLFERMLKTNDENKKPETSKLDDVLKYLDRLSIDIGNIKKEILKPAATKESYEANTEELEREVEETIKKIEEPIRRKIKKYKRRKNEYDKHMQTFSSENLDKLTKGGNANDIPITDSVQPELNVAIVPKAEIEERMEKNRQQALKLEDIRRQIAEKAQLIQNQSGLDEWFNKISSKEWKSLAGFAAAKNLLSKNGRQMLYKMGIYIDKKWKPTIAQLEYAKDLYDKIIEDYEAI